LHDGIPPPLTIRILGRERDVHFDIAGGSRIPKIGERRARSVRELREAGVGIDRVLLVHDNTPESSDLFQGVLTMLDPKVVLGVVRIPPLGESSLNGSGTLGADLQRASRLGREVAVHPSGEGSFTVQVLRLVREFRYDLLIISTAPYLSSGDEETWDVKQLTGQAPCRIFLSVPASIPLEPET
jgi:hypothetical protein